MKKIYFLIAIFFLACKTFAQDSTQFTVSGDKAAGARMSAESSVCSKIRITGTISCIQDLQTPAYLLQLKVINDGGPIVGWSANVFPGTLTGAHGPVSLSSGTTNLLPLKIVNVPGGAIALTFNFSFLSGGSCSIKATATLPNCNNCKPKPYTDSNTFKQQISSLNVIRFNNRDNGTLISNPASDLTIPNFTRSNFSFLNIHSYYNNFIYSMPSQVLRINCPPNIKTIGFKYADFYGHSLPLQVKLSTGEMVNLTTPVSGVGQVNYHFWGVKTCNAIQWIEIKAMSNYYIMIDDFFWAY